MNLSCTLTTDIQNKKYFWFAVFMLFNCSFVAWSQDAVGRFELGGSLIGVRDFKLSSSVGVGVEGDLNLGRHVALDAAIDWLPLIGDNTVVGLFGAKVGTRTQHFGFFGKVRPGFVTIGSVFRESTLSISPSFVDTRFDRLTQPTLDLGGVVEYYPARHWALRWDIGDMLTFEDDGPKFTAIFPGQPPIITTTNGKVTNNFRFSTGVHYRF